MALIKFLKRKINDIEKGSQRAGAAARRQVNKAAPVVRDFVKEMPKQIASGLIRSGAIGANTAIKAMEKAEDVVTAPLGKGYKDRLQKLRKANSDTEDRVLNKLQPLEQKKGQGLRNYIKDTYNQALPEIKNVKNSTPLQRGASIADLALTIGTAGASQVGKQTLSQIAKQYGRNALVQGAGGAAGAATIKDATAGDIAGGAIAGAVIGTGIKGAGDIGRAGIKEIPKITSKVGDNIKSSLENPQFQPGFIGNKSKSAIKLKTETKPQDLAKQTIEGFTPAPKPVEAKAVSFADALKEKQANPTTPKVQNKTEYDLARIADKNKIPVEDIKQIQKNTGASLDRIEQELASISDKADVKSKPAYITEKIRTNNKFDGSGKQKPKARGISEEEANKLSREGFDQIKEDPNAPIIKLKSEKPVKIKKPEQLAKETLETPAPEPMKPEIAPVARVFEKDDVSIPETPIKTTESRLGNMVDDFYQSKKGNNKIKLKDLERLGEEVYSQTEKDFAEIGSNFQDVLRKTQEDARKEIKTIKDSSLTPKEANVWKKYEAELDYVRRNASTGNKKIGGGDIGELFSPQRKPGFGTEESLLTGFRAEKPGSEIKRTNVIPLDELDYSKAPIVEYVVSYGSPKGLKAERIARTLQRENPDLDTQSIQRATSQFMRIQDDINSIETKIEAFGLGQKRQINKDGKVVDSAKLLSEMGDTLKLEKQVINTEPKGLTNGDRIDSVKIRDKKLGEVIGLDQWRDSWSYASEQVTNLSKDRNALTGSIRNRLQEKYNLSKDSIDYMVKRIENTAPDVPDNVLLASVYQTYKTAAKQQILQQLQRLDIQNPTLRKDVSDLTNQILREGSIQSKASAKIVSGVLTTQDALFRRFNLGSAINELADIPSLTNIYRDNLTLTPDFRTVKEFGLGDIDAAIEPYVRQLGEGKAVNEVLKAINNASKFYKFVEFYKAAVIATSAKKLYKSKGLTGDALTEAILNDYRKIALPVDAFTKTALDNIPAYTQYMTWGVRNLEKERMLALGELEVGELANKNRMDRIIRNAYTNIPAKLVFWISSNALKGTAILTAIGFTDFTGLSSGDFSGIQEEDKNIANRAIRALSASTTLSMLGSFYEIYQKEQLKEQYKDEDYNPYANAQFGEDLLNKLTPAAIRNYMGAKDLMEKGYATTKDGRILYEAPEDLYNKSKAFLFGKGQTDKGRESRGTQDIFNREGNVFRNLADMALEQVNLKDTNYKKALNKEYTEAYKSTEKEGRTALLEGGREFNSYLANLEKNDKPAYDNYIKSLDGNHVLPEYWQVIASNKDGVDLTIFNTLKARNKQKQKDLGVAYDPIYDLTDEQAKSVIQQKATATGEDIALRNILYKEGWYKDYMDKTKEYYNNKKPTTPEEKKQTERVKQWYNLNDKYNGLRTTKTDDGKEPEWAKQYPLVYRSKLINEKYGFDSPESKAFYKDNSDNYKAQKELYDAQNLELINQMRTIEGVPPLGPEAFAQATNIKNTSGSSGFGGGGSKTPKARDRLALIKLKSEPDTKAVRFKFKARKPVIRLSKKPAEKVKKLTIRNIRVK